MERLNEIGTRWSKVHLAVSGTGPQATQAQGELFQRYSGAMRRYLQVALDDPAAVDDIIQDFGVALVSGGFRNAQPERGRFRDYLKGVLFRLVHKHRRRQQRQAKLIAAKFDLTDPDGYRNECEEQFRQSWREELLASTWEALAQTDPTFHTILHYRAEHPDMRSEDMVQELTQQLGKPLTAQGVRQSLSRARKRFVNLLLQQVAGSLEFPTPGAIQEELRDLDLATFVLAPRKS